LLNVDERRGYQALIAVGALVGMIAAALLLSVVDWPPVTDTVVVVAGTVAGGLVTWPFARRESRAWVRRRQHQDAA
jgi:uncharacterized membrane protein YdjX (TVP38/TMEM64 family)